MLATCQKCHPDASRKFTGYLTHATHHDPKKYPWIFYSFWAMTALLVGTFAASGVHTLLWLPTTFTMRRRHGRPGGAVGLVGGACTQASGVSSGRESSGFFRPISHDGFIGYSWGSKMTQ